MLLALFAVVLLPFELMEPLLGVVRAATEESELSGTSTLDAVSRSSRGEMIGPALTGDTMEPTGEAEVADTEEEGGVEAGADTAVEESGFANRTPSYCTPLNSIVTTSFWSPLLASPRLISLNCMPVMPSGELNGSPSPPDVFFEWCRSLSGVRLSRWSPFSCFRSSRATLACNCLW